MELMERLPQVRKLRGMNQETLAERIGVSRQAVSKWETGEAMPDSQNLVAMADVLEVSLDYLCGRTEGFEPFSAAAESSGRNGNGAEKPFVLKILAILFIFMVAVAAILLLLRGGDAATQPDPVPDLPDVVTASDVQIGKTSAGALSCSFVPSVAGEGMEWKIIFRSPDGAEKSYEAKFFGGICSANVLLGKEGYGYTVIASLGNGDEIRLVTLAKDVHWNESNSGWAAPE